MNMKKLITLTAMATTMLAIGAGTFESIPFNQPTFSDVDPLGVTAITTAQSTATEAKTTATEAKEKATALETTIAETVQKGQLTNDVVIVGNAKGANGAGMESTTTSIVFAVNRDIDELDAANGEILFAADKVRFSTGIGAIWFGDQTLQSILAGAGQGEVNAIQTIKVNGAALTPDGDRAVDITIPSAGDANVIEGITTNGVAVALNGKIANIVIPAPGEGNLIESITVNGGSALPINNKNVDITIPAGGDANVIESIKTNGIALAVTDKAVDIAIPAPGDMNVIESITTNGIALAVNNKVVDIAIPAPGDANLIETVKTNGVALTITDKAVDIAVPPAITALYDIPGAEIAATNAIQRINDAQDISEIKSALTDFLGNFKKPVAP